MTVARYASVGFVVAVAAVMAWLNLDYARRVFTDVPFVDDWYFIEILRAHARGELGLRHLFMTHQGHPSLPGRLSFLLSYRLQGFDLLTVRWLSILTVLAAAAVAGAATAAIILRQPRDAGVTQPGFVLGVPIVIAVCATLGQWEIYSFAMGIGNASVNLYGFAAIFAMHGWLERRRWSWLALALACAVASNLSMGQGALVWAALAFMMVLHPDRRRLLPLAAAMLAVCVAAALLQAQGMGSSPGGSVSKLDLGRAVRATLGLLGVPLIGQIGNAVVVPLSMAFGVAVLGLGLVGLLRLPDADPAQCRAMLPFLGCIAWGGGALVLIVIGRQEGPMFAQLAPRYTPIIAPIVVGLVGLLGVGASWASLGGRLLTALFVLAVVGLGVTNVEERNMAHYRPDAFARMEAAILNGFAGLDAAGRREAVFSNDLTADKAVAGAAFLREERLGPFRRQ